MQYHDWTFISETSDSKFWLCKCKCGELVSVNKYNIQRGYTRRCRTCYHESSVKHGHARKKYGRKRSPLYGVWEGMRNRCLNKNHTAYKRYGARGITICERWNDFRNFFLDMAKGFHEDLTLDRIDNDKGYFKENCRWVSRKENSRNRHNSVFYEFNNERKTIAEWAEKIGISQQAMSHRFKSWPIELAISAPKNIRFR